MATTTKTVNFKPFVSIVPAGTPIDTNGEAANNSNAIGIVTEDVKSPNKVATVLTSGEWDIAYGYANSGIMLAEECMKALSNITFKNNGETVKFPFSGSYNDLTNKPAIPGRATEEAAGTVLMASNVAEAAGSAPTAEEFNGLVNALIDSGAIAEAEGTE